MKWRHCCDDVKIGCGSGFVEKKQRSGTDQISIEFDEGLTVATQEDIIISLNRLRLDCATRDFAICYRLPSLLMPSTLTCGKVFLLPNSQDAVKEKCPTNNQPLLELSAVGLTP
jgi:hypothetical protein